jgi:hypothetical protein
MEVKMLWRNIFTGTGRNVIGISDEENVVLYTVSLAGG